MKILVLAAHPDDETIGCGGTIARLCKNPDNFCHLITFTDGESSRNNTTYNRNNLLKDICKILNIDKYSYGNFPDNKMDSVPLLDICKFIESNVDFIPDIIFTHHHNCNNIDHQIVFKATITVFRPQYGNNQKILSYFIPSSTDYNPYNNFILNVFYNITNEIDTKMKALKIYDSEIKEYPHTRSYKNIKNLAAVFGSKVGIEYAEVFELVREIL